jgi:hypothetical protein
MRVHYEFVHDKALFKKHFGVSLPSELARRDVWPDYMSTFDRMVDERTNLPGNALVGSPSK